jgi:ATP-binding cassette, subfamily C, bacteriocin exporter
MGYPCVKQPDQSSCGAAALSTIALFYKKAVNFQQIRELAGTDQIGTNFSGLKNVGERLGFEVIGVGGTYEELHSVPLPAIAHVINKDRQGHFAVIFELTKTGVIIADPSSGIETLTKEEFCKIWSGRLLLFSPRDDFAEAGKDVSTKISPWDRYLKLLLPHTPRFTEIFVASIILVFLSLASAFFIQHLVDSVLVHGESRLLNVLAIGMIILILFKALFGVIKQYLLSYIGRKILLSLISGFLRHVLHLPLRFFETQQTGDILSRINDTVKINQLISGTTITVVLNSVLTVMFLGIMFYYDFKLTLMVVAFLPLLVLSIWAFDPKIRKLSRRTMENAARMQSYMVENVAGIASVKALGTEEQRCHGSDERLVEMIQTGFSLQMITLKQQFLQTLVTGTLGITVLWYGGHRVMDGALSIGQLMFFNTLLGSLLEPLNGLVNAQVAVRDGLISLDRIGEIIDLPREPLHEINKCQLQSVQDGIHLKNVTFGYGSRGDVLQNVSIQIPVGQRVAIVGESGSGKTTILKLLLRFYDPTKGVITIDGRDTRDINISSLRSRIGFVSQEPNFFYGSIKQNITAGMPTATFDQIAAVTQAVALERFINGLPERYETILGEGGINLSGGQRQRLALARVLLQDPEIVIFDEATSHLDSRTEQTIQNNLLTYLKGKTVVIVAHRLSSIRTADLIYVLEQGRVVESGVHAQLLRQNGFYADYWHSQVGYDRDMAPPNESPVDFRPTYESDSLPINA